MGTPASSGNRGVQALGSALAQLCIDADSRVQIILFGSHRDSLPIPMRLGGKMTAVPIVHWRMSPKARLRDHLFIITLLALFYRCIPLNYFRNRIAASIPWIKALEETDIIGDIRGGDSFSDIYGLKRYVIATLEIWTVILVKGSIVHFPQTYGPFRTRTSRVIARYLLSRSSILAARDKESQRIAQELAGKSIKVQLSPDVAFSLYVERPLAIQTDPPLSGPLPPDIIGLNINGLMFNGGYSRGNMFGLKLDYASFLPDLVTQLLREHAGELLLVPHTFAPAGNVESDNEASWKLRAALPADLQKRIRIVTAEYDCHELKGIIGQCDFFIGARMHSCIAALSQGVPCVGVAYSMKFRGVFETVGADEFVVDGRSTTNLEAVKRIVELYRQRNTIRADLQKRAAAAKSRLAEIFSSLLQHHVTDLAPSPSTAKPYPPVM